MAEIQKSATATILATASATGIALHLFFFKHVSARYLQQLRSLQLILLYSLYFRRSAMNMMVYSGDFLSPP